MSKASESHIKANEAIIAAGTAPASTIALAKENVDLWLSIDGQPGKYGTSYAAAPAEAPAPAAPAADKAPERAPARTPAPAVREETDVPTTFEGRVEAGLANDDDIADMTLAEWTRYIAKFPPEVPAEWVTDPERRAPDTRTDADLLAGPDDAAKAYNEGWFERLQARKGYRDSPESVGKAFEDQSKLDRTGWGLPGEQE